MSSLCNIFMLSSFRSFLWVLIKGNGIRFSFFLRQAFSWPWMSLHGLQVNGISHWGIVFLCPSRYVTWIPDLLHFGLATCSCSKVVCWPEAVAVGGQVKREKVFSTTHSSSSLQNLPLRGGLSGPPTGHIVLSLLYFPFLRFSKCFQWSAS